MLSFSANLLHFSCINPLPLPFDLKTPRYVRSWYGGDVGQASSPSEDPTISGFFVANKPNNVS